MQNLFEDFAPATKAQWLAQIEKELKGKSYESLFWQLGDGISVEPFYTREEMDETPQPIDFPAYSPVWKIGEDIAINTDTAAARKTLLEALEGGVNAPRLIVQNENWTGALEDVHLEMIELHLAGESGMIVADFKNYLDGQNLNPEKLKGAFHFDPDSAAPEKAVAFFKKWKDELPHFQLFTINGTIFWKGNEHIADELFQILEKAVQLLDALTDAGFPAEAIAPRIRFSIAIGVGYFAEMAKIRALKILWANVLEAYRVPDFSIFTEVHFAPAAYDENANTNMIRGTAMALCAAVAGADRITVLPSNALTGAPDNFSRRIARNVQHILQLESHIGKVTDPAAGSYFIEKLTAAFVEKVWEKIQKL